MLPAGRNFQEGQGPRKIPNDFSCIRLPTGVRGQVNVPFSHLEFLLQRVRASAAGFRFSPRLGIVLSNFRFAPGLARAQNANETVGSEKQHAFESGHFGENIDILNVRLSTRLNSTPMNTCVPEGLFLADHGPASRLASDRILLDSSNTTASYRFPTSPSLAAAGKRRCSARKVVAP